MLNIGICERATHKIQIADAHLAHTFHADGGRSGDYPCSTHVERGMGSNSDADLSHKFFLWKNTVIPNATVLCPCTAIGLDMLCAFNQQERIFEVYYSMIEYSS